MEVLTELWDKTTDAFSALSEGVSEGLVRLFGSSNERKIRQMRPEGARLNELEPCMRPAVARSKELELSMRAMSEDELRAKTQELRLRRARGESLDDLLPEAF